LQISELNLWTKATREGYNANTTPVQVSQIRAALKIPEEKLYCMRNMQASKDTYHTWKNSLTDLVGNYIVIVQ